MGSFRIPSRIAPGAYKVRLLTLDKGRVVHSEVTSLGVGMVGVPAFLPSLAQKHGALYGLFAIFIAVVFGFIVGIVFRKRK